jgi:hypothetical protein
MRKSKYTKELLTPIVENCTSWSQVIKTLGLKCTGGNYRHIQSKVQIHQIDTSHFKGQGWSKGFTANDNDTVKLVTSKITHPDDYVFKKNSPYTGNLKGRMIKTGEWDYECSICSINEWRGEPLTLHVDHIDGCHYNNEKNNLRFLCPNCHNQTSTWGNRDRKK